MGWFQNNNSNDVNNDDATVSANDLHSKSDDDDDDGTTLSADDLNADSDSDDNVQLKDLKSRGKTLDGAKKRFDKNEKERRLKALSDEMKKEAGQGKLFPESKQRTLTTKGTKKGTKKPRKGHSQAEWQQKEEGGTSSKSNSSF